MKLTKFNEFVQLNGQDWKQHISDSEIANSYFHEKNIKVKELALKSGRSIGEVYRIIYNFGGPTRRNVNYENVYQLANSGLPVKKIAELTGYTTRNVRYILKKAE